jgi:hypothetical protein
MIPFRAEDLSQLPQSISPVYRKHGMTVAETNIFAIKHNQINKLTRPGIAIPNMSQL